MRALFTLIILSSLVACSKAKDSFRRVPPRSSVQSPETTPLSFKGTPGGEANFDWLPERTELRCAAKSCIPQVGLLIYITGTTVENKVKMIHFERCTGSLIASDLVLSNDHCDFTEHPGYFVVGVGEKKQIRKVQRVVYSKYSPSGDLKDQNLAPDVAIFQLDKPVKEIPPLTVASDRQLEFDRLIGYVINEDGQRKEDGFSVFRIDELNCQIRRHEQMFPYDVAEVPDVIMGFDCAAVRGNSGSPLFAEGHPEIQAVLQGIVDPEAHAAQILSVEHRQALPFEKHWAALSTNVRCLDYPGHSAQACTKVSREDSKTRFDKLLSAVIPTTPLRNDTGMSYVSRAFEFQGSSLLANDEYELLFMPSCRTRSGKLSDIIYPSEHIKMKLDEWATPRVEVIETRDTQAQVEKDDGVRVILKADWSAPFAPIQDQEKHPRQKWGSSFAIDLPPCTG